MRSLHSSIQFTGSIVSNNPKDKIFEIELLTKEVVPIRVTVTTWYQIMKNIGDENRDRVPQPDSNDVVHKIGKKEDASSEAEWNAQRQMIQYLKPGLLVAVIGMSSENDNTRIYIASEIVLMHSEPNKYGWEETHWWVQQIGTLFGEWLDVLFLTKREFCENDFAEFYRTNLDLLGGPTTNTIQECATMSRFLYGLSSSYLLTGNERAFSAAKACAKYLINAYSNTSHDGQYVFWKFGRVQDAKSTRDIISSLNPDDLGSYALYEQIYALAGLAQFYRISQDTSILNFITRTMAAFNRFFKDDIRNGAGYNKSDNTTTDPCYKGLGGYFSHLDPVTMRPDAPSLGQNSMRKNWNSIGDHIPAYLINLILSIDPIPKTIIESSWDETLLICREMLVACVGNILDHFGPEKDQEGNPTTAFVNERFFNDWAVDHTWGWQQDRGIVGHNLKISWNLTRCGHYFVQRSEELRVYENNDEEADKYHELAHRCYSFAIDVGNRMKEVGVDLMRGGIFDALERHPKNGFKTEFAWAPTKDFWQQEQSVLAYYIMHGIRREDKEKDEFLTLARYCSAFWSLFFIDQDYRKVYFRTSESGTPVIQGQYGIQAGHAVAGYHAFELSYLAHIYIRSYVEREDGHSNFVLYYKPDANSGIKSLNVLPDFFRPGELKIIQYKINGIPYPVKGPEQFIYQIALPHLTDNTEVAVEYLPVRNDGQAEANIRSERERFGPLQNIAYKIKTV